jgi:hypothetical protein
MIKEKLSDIADAIGPQTMVSRIGKMPIEVQKTLFGPLQNKDSPERSLKKSLKVESRNSYIYEESDMPNNKKKTTTNPYRNNPSSMIAKQVPESQRRSMINAIQRGSKFASKEPLFNHFHQYLQPGDK